MKKFLSLVLALVMAMSLVTISAGAADFSDEASIDPIYAEAVDVISALGIVSGNNGAFMPQDNLTRGAAAKILTGILIGADQAAKLPKTSTFSDVAAGSTFAGYISYLKGQGIIGGYADGTFGPANKLTGDAFLKQVLGVLGYKADVEGYQGTGWQVNVAIDALEAGLLKGMEENFNSANLITREQAAQIILNALQADMVKYDSQSTIIVAGIEIKNTSEAKKVTGDAAKHYDKTAGVTADAVMQLCEKSFPTLEKIDDTTDDMARPATQWNYKSKSLVLSVDAADMQYVSSPKYNTVYSNLGLTADKVGFIAYEDGVVYSNTNLTNYGYNGQLTADSTSNIRNSAYRCTFEVYYDADEAVAPVTAIIINQYLGKVSAATGTGDDRVITVVPMEEGATSFPAGKTSLTYTTTEFAVDDVVVFTYSKAATKIQTIAVADSITGEVTGSEIVSKRADIYVDEIPVNYAYPTADLFNNSGLKIGDTVKVYLDTNSRYLYVEEVMATADKYAYVLKAGQNAGTDATWLEDSTAGSHGAQLLFVDGTVEVVETSASVTGLVNEFVKYYVNEDGEYVLSIAGADDVSGAAAVEINKDKTSINAKVNGANVTLGNGTVVLVKTKEGTKTVYTTYLGYKNVPEMSGTALADAIKVKSSDATVAYIFVDATAEGFKMETAADKDSYIFINTTDSGRYYSDANNSWYQYNAVVDGEVITIKVDDANKAEIMKQNPNYGKKLFTSYAVDEDGFYSFEIANVLYPTYKFTTQAGGQGLQYVDGLLICGINAENTGAASAFALDEDVVIVYNNSNATYLWTESNFTKDTNDYTWLYDIDGDTDIDYVIIQKN